MYNCPEPTVEGKADDTSDSIDTMDSFTSSVPSFDITIAGKVEYDTADIPSDMVSESGDDGARSAKGCGIGSSTVIRGHGFNDGDYEGYDGMPLHTVKSEASYTIYSQASDTSLGTSHSKRISSFYPSASRLGEDADAV